MFRERSLDTRSVDLGFLKQRGLAAHLNGGHVGFTDVGFASFDPVQVCTSSDIHEIPHCLLVFREQTERVDRKMAWLLPHIDADGVRSGTSRNAGGEGSG